MIESNKFYVKFSQINQIFLSIINWMINLTTKKGYSEINRLEDHKAEMSWQKLSVLLVLLAFIWILCYNAQLQFPVRHISDTYDRIGDRNVSQLSIKYAQKLLNNSKNMQEKQMSYFEKKYGFEKFRQQQICVILIHTQKLKPQKWMKSVQILLQQDYANYKIYYINNYEAGQRIYNYIQQNSLNKEKIKIIDDIPNTDYAKQFDYAKNYCSLKSIVVYMYDQDQLIGSNVFASINAAFSKNNDLKFLYSASLAPVGKFHDGTWKYGLGRSYPYPQQIIKQGQYYKYPFIVDGLMTFKAEIFRKTANNLLNKQNQPFKKAGMVALGMTLLDASKQQVGYFPQPLILKKKINEYITLDQELKEEIKEIFQKYKQ